jgi:hypothetical protein
MRERPNTRAAYEREVRFYEQLAPRTRLRTPTYFYGDVDTVSGWHILLLEDLAPAHCGSRVDGCTQAQAKLIIEEVAHFHADWWESPQLSQIDWLFEKHTASDEELGRLHSGWWPIFLGKVRESLPNTLIEIGERLGEHRGRIARHLFETSPRTVVHADYQLDNLMFGSFTGGRPFAVVDWQFVRLGRGIWDVAYFLCQNLTPRDRRAIEPDILLQYQGILADNGVRDYGSDQVLKDYRLSLLHRFGALISTIAAMPFSKDQIRMHVDVLLPRNIAAILDQEAGVLLA